jgi:glucose dehydrogenase
VLEPISGSRPISGAILLISALLCGYPSLAYEPTLDSIWDSEGQAEAFADAFAIDVSQGTVVSSGDVCTVPDGLHCVFFVRAADLNTGATLWEDRKFGFPGFGFNRSQGVVISEGRAFASGWIMIPPYKDSTGNYRGYFDFVVIAYDLKTGATLWRQRFDRGLFDLAEKITAANGRVFVAGRVQGATSGNSDFTVMAFDASSGQELWESVTNYSGVDIAFGIATDGRRVYSAGSVRNESAVAVRALSAATGNTLWTDEIPGGQIYAPYHQLSLSDGDLYLACGILTPAGGEDVFVRAYDMEHGSIRWTRQLSGGGVGEAFAVASKDGRVVVTGEAGADANFFGGSLTVLALNAETGASIWSDHFQPVAGADAYGATVDINDDVVMVGGAAQDVVDPSGSSAAYRWTARAYDVSSGKLLASEWSVHGKLNAVTAASGRFFATGNSSNGQSSSFKTVSYASPSD